MIGANDSRVPSSRAEAHRNGERAGIRAKLTPRELAGVALTVLSYAVGWPAVALVGALSVRMGEPLLAALGIPSLLVVSHLTFALGLYLAGGRRLAGLLRQVWRSRAR